MQKAFDPTFCVKKTVMHDEIMCHLAEKLDSVQISNAFKICASN